MATGKEVRRIDVWAAAGVIIAALGLVTGWAWRSSVASILLEAQAHWRADIDTTIKPINDRLDRVEQKVDRVAEGQKR